MSGECEGCGEHTIECTCRDGWTSINQKQPEKGQLCSVKLVSQIQAYYEPNGEQQNWRTPNIDQEAAHYITAWKPVFVEELEDKPCNP